MFRDALDRGFWRVATLREVPIRIHWTTPIGLFVFTGFRVAPIAWLAFVALLLIHELGHALIARRLGHRVLAVDVTGFGGLCRWSGGANAYERGAVAWGGVLAQAILLLLTLTILLVAGQPASPALAELASTFTVTNLWLIAINLLPLPPLDGAEAWPIFPAALARFRQRLTAWRARPNRERGHHSSAVRTLTPDSELAALFKHISDEAGRARGGRRVRR